MTKEENIATLNEHLDHWKRLLSEKICDQSEGEKTIDALQNAIKALEQTRWIPVSERLPEEAGMYLCSYGDDDIATSYFDIRMNEFNVFHKQVTAWMPLPKPYKAKKEV